MGAVVMNEKLSALIDAELDELEERRVLDTLSQNPELRLTWERYHLVRAVINRQLEIIAPRGLAGKIYDRLQLDPPAVRRPHYRWVGGVAAAASIAVVVMMGLPVWQKPSTPAAPTLVSSTFTPTDTDLVSTGDTTAAERVEGGLNVYLVGHNEFMPTAGMGGMLPYVRVVTYDSNK